MRIEELKKRNISVKRTLRVLPTVMIAAIAGDEAEVMGEYLLRASYMSRAEFEGLGCDPYLSLPYDDM